MHTEQLRLSGTTEEQYSDMDRVVGQVKGSASYLLEEGYSIDRFRHEVGEIMFVTRKKMESSETDEIRK